MTPPPRRNRMNFPAQAGAVLDSLTQKMGVHDRLQSYRVWQVWGDVVGPQTSQHAQPSRLRAGVLEVRVDHPVWMQQLQLLKPKILEQLNLAIAPSVLDEIHLQHGRPEVPASLPPILENPPLSLTLEEEKKVDNILPPDEDDVHCAWRKLLALHVKMKAHSES